MQLVTKASLPRPPIRDSLAGMVYDAQQRIPPRQAGGVALRREPVTRRVWPLGVIEYNIGSIRLAAYLNLPFFTIIIAARAPCIRSCASPSV